VRGSDEATERELAQALSEALARFGLAGTVTIVDNDAVLASHGPTVRAELYQLKDEWPALDDPARQRRALDVARRLASLRRASLPPPKRRSGISGLLIALSLLLVVGAGYAWLSVEKSGEPALRSVSSVPSGVAAFRRAERETNERAARACEKARERVMRGATLGPLEVDGWVIEIALLAERARPLGDDPALAEFFERPKGDRPGRVVWLGSPVITAVSAPGAGVDIVDEVAGVGAPAPFRGLRVILRGPYAHRYFRPEQRVEFVTLAHHLSKQLDVAYAGLYARCESGTQHHMGAWFRGPGVSGSSTALVYFMGTYADVPHVRSALLEVDGSSFDRGAALKVVRDAADKLDRQRVARLIGAHGGMIAGREPDPVSLSFPFKDGNRASRASLDLARATGIGAAR
jgi:serine/threonine-protein kinase